MSLKNKEHMIPELIKNLGVKVSRADPNSNEYFMLVSQLETIREYIDSILYKKGEKSQ